MMMPFGRHKGEDVHDIPLHYLEWLRDNCGLYGELEAAVDEAIDANFARLEEEGVYAGKKG